MKINTLLKFIKFSLLFRKIDRKIYAVDDNRMENDVEHSYQLAILTWYVIEVEKLKLDKELAIKYAIIHDLEEAISGDVYIFDTHGRKNKEKLEEKARKKIMKMFPGWKEYKKLSIKYKTLRDEESRLVNGLDKVLPVLNIYIDGGRIWKTEDVTFEKLVDNKRPKVKVHPTSKAIWEQLEKILKENELELFGKLS